MSLYTAVHAIAVPTQITKASGAESALRLVAVQKPDVFLADANSLANEMGPLLKSVKKLCPEMIRVVSSTAGLHQRRFIAEGADFVIDESSLDQEFTQILRNIAVYKKNRGAISEKH